MKKVINYILLMILFTACKRDDGRTQSSFHEVSINEAYPCKDTLTKLGNEYTAAGIPGIVMAVYSPSWGYWGTANGYSELETKTAMNLQNLQYLQSVSKTYLAAGILKLREEGRVNLDAPITSYLPARYAGYIDQASTMTVRNLLNHTSGMPDYLENPEYISRALQHPEHVFSSDEFLRYIKNVRRLFVPGSRFSYSNTNYHVLALIADSIYGSHDRLIREKVLTPLGLFHTYYRNIAGLPALVKNYLDYSGTGELQNVTVLQQSSIMG
ncbi:MAG: serine hydrolase domain-containing protein, partial [Bacteroidota bacterium]